MDRHSAQPRKAQLDKEEREHLEDVVTEMRDRVETNVRYQLEQYNLKDCPSEDASLSDEEEVLNEAIKLETVDGDNWKEGYRQYITGTSFTIVNRLTALRCMEVRDFIDEEVTAFREDGLTPAAERLVIEEFMIEEEAIIEAYRNACVDFAEDIEILFDRSMAYSLIDPDNDTYENLCRMLDEVPDEVWRSADVLGWVYEYYNRPVAESLHTQNILEPGDIGPANQFYTPHWVVRMLTDNSLGKLYLEGSGSLQETVDAQYSMTSDQRRNRPVSPDESPDVADFCTYLAPSAEEGESPELEHPEDIQVVDPACGSGHFLLYAFDVLERIWRAETDLNHAEIPQEILLNNLYGVDIDMRACQLAAFSLYMKARTRAEDEGANSFEMSEMNIVCADTKVTHMEASEEELGELANGKPEIENILRKILNAFECVRDVGSLLDVRGTLGGLFEDELNNESLQININDDPSDNHTLSQLLGSLREVVGQHQEGDTLLVQDLRSFIRLLDVLTQDYDVALMNPPYRSQNKIPPSLHDYIHQHYDFNPHIYNNFYEICDNLSASHGRIGMLVPRSFILKQTFRDFRESILQKGSVDLLAEYGVGVLDNATVRTVGAVIQTDVDSEKKGIGQFVRLHDVDVSKKESVYIHEILGDRSENNIQRYFEVSLSEFSKIPGSPLSYYAPQEIRDLHETECKIDADKAGIEGENVADVVQGFSTGDNDRFFRHHWETTEGDGFLPIFRGSSDAWVQPRSTEMCYWNGGEEIKRHPHSLIRNEAYYRQEGLTWTHLKNTESRIGYYPKGGLFDNTGSMLFPKDDKSLWTMLAVLNSSLYHALALSITDDRSWSVEDLGRLPWRKKLEENEFLIEYAKRQHGLVTQLRHGDPTSPFYTGSQLLPNDESCGFYYAHPHTDKVNSPESSKNSHNSTSLASSAREWKKQRSEIQSQLETLASEIDEVVFEVLQINQKTREKVRQEIYLRTGKKSKNIEKPDHDSVPDNLDGQTKNLVHHFAMEAVHEESDGIIPLERVGEQPSMLDRIVEQFEDTYGEYAEDRLVEVDDILGGESTADVAYPHLRTFIEDDLFAYHVDTMENTPILWKLSTERLFADSEGEGFACFIDYHQLDASLFNRLSNQYLESRKAELRKRQLTANQHRNDESLSTSERSDAIQEFKFCSNALEQIDEFEEVIQALDSTNERRFDADDRERVNDLASRVALFREETAERIDTLSGLRERNDEKWFQDTFSEYFWDKVDEWREEWLDALDELEYACKEYAKPREEPVEAHLADLFDYFNRRLKGSDHPASTGILFLPYYFEREGDDLLNDEGEPLDDLTEDERMLASLAMGVDNASVLNEEYLKAMTDEDEDMDDLPPIAEFKALAEEIDDRCQTVQKRIHSDWEYRALSEITTAGYQPNHKHGVIINITPLAKRSIVPEIVEDKVL